MTLFVVDVSKYQAERKNKLDPVRARSAGFGALNIALDRGRAEDVLPPWAPWYAAQARVLGLGICTYRWLDNRMPGADSARRAYDRIVTLGGPEGMAHAVDVEDNATEQTVRDYLITMTRLMGRPVALYSADWWWTVQSRNWPMSDLTPYLWGAPNERYLPDYPGNTSAHWQAGWGGWDTFSILQYSVKPLPGEVDDCSMSAIRDPAVWAALTGEVESMTNAPADLMAIRSWLVATLDLAPGVARGSDLEANEVGIVGDPAHAASGGYHEGNDDLARVGRLTSDYSKRESPRDRPGSNAASALDIGMFDATIQGRRITLRSLSAEIDAACRRKDPRCRDIRELIWSPDGTTVKRYDALGIRSTGDSSHRTHSHLSFFRDSEGRRNRDDNFLGLLKAIIAGSTNGDDMYEQFDRDRVNATWELAVAVKEAVAELATDFEALKARPVAGLTDEDRAALVAAVKMVGGEQLAGIVASAVDSRIPAIVRAVNDDAAERAKE